MVEEKPKISQEKKDRYELTEVVTETTVAVKDNKIEKVLSQVELLVEILNKIDNIEKAIAG